MKRCPTCNQLYSDDNLNFCLTDGTPLSRASDSEATVAINTPLDTRVLTAPPTQALQSSHRGISPIFAYAILGLLLLLIGGGVVLWLKLSAEPSAAESQNTTPSQTSTPAVQSSNNAPAAKLYRVVGVAYNDVLYVRPKPTERDVYVAKIPANGVGIQILEGSQQVGDNIWVKVSYKGLTGWVNSKFLTEQ